MVFYSRFAYKLMLFYSLIEAILYSRCNESAKEASKSCHKKDCKSGCTIPNGFSDLWPNL